jgi:putative ABC transport system permease protein
MGVDGPHVEVVGVARNGKYLSLAETPQPYFYLPFAQQFRTRMTLLVETEARPATMTDRVLQVVRSLDPNQPVYNVRDMRRYFDHGVLGIALTVLKMVWCMGFTGLALALIGLHGLMSYSVSRRTREIGIRMAIGACRGQVLRMVMRQGLVLAGCGVLLGFALSVPVFQALAAALAGLGGLSPWTLLVVPAGLILVALAACYFPARRASAIDPSSALRLE